MKFNCDSANKLVKSLMSDLETIEKVEQNDSTYSYKPGEEPEIPVYNLAETTAKIDAINEKIYKLKHAINEFNTTTKVEGFEFTLDEALVRLKVLSKRRNTLNSMRSLPESSRQVGFRGEAEITRPNFNLADAEAEYQRINKELTALQQGINITNLTKTFEVEI